MHRIPFVLIAALIFNSTSLLASGEELRLNRRVTPKNFSEFDVNDATFVFPLVPNSMKLYPEILADEQLNRNEKPVLSLRLFRDLLAKQSEQLNQLDDSSYARLRVISFRYDPCFPGPQHTPDSCIQQVRAILQPMDPQFGADDFALHLFFELGRGLPSANDPQIVQLRRIKQLSLEEGVKTSGVPLSVHPGLSSEAAIEHSQKIGNAIRGLFLASVAKGKLTEIALTGGDADADMSFGAWSFQKGKVRGSSWEPERIPRLNSIDQKSDSVGKVESRPISAPRIFPLAIKLDVPFPSAEDRLEQLETIMNPRITNPLNMDCVSCHLASQLDLSVSAELAQLRDPLRPFRVSANQFTIPPGTTGFADPKYKPSSDPSGFQNVRVIGRLFGDLQITQLAANSAANVAHMLNQIRSGEVERVEK